MRSDVSLSEYSRPTTKSIAFSSRFLIGGSSVSSNEAWRRWQVYIAGAAAGEQQAAGRAAKHDSYALDKISIRVSPKVGLMHSNDMPL